MQGVYFGGILRRVGLGLFLLSFLVHFANFGRFDFDGSTVRLVGLLAFSGIALQVVGHLLQRHTSRRWQPPLDPGRPSPPGDAPDILIRCTQCRALNDEDARHCKHCGSKL